MDAAIDIRPTYSAMGFASEVAPVYALVWGQQPVRLRWKAANRIPVPAGATAVGIWMKWVTKAHMGLSHASLQLAPGEVVGLEWKAPGTIFTAGKITVADLGSPVALAVPEATPPPGDLGPQQVRPPHVTRPLASVPLVEAAPVAAPAGAWHPDPTGRFPHRWWDGARWTETVSDGTTTTTDPL